MTKEMITILEHSVDKERSVVVELTWKEATSEVAIAVAKDKIKQMEVQIAAS